MVEKTDIEKLALTDPIVRAHLYMQRSGLVSSWDEMMCALVVSLVEAKNAAHETAVYYAERMPATPLLMSSRTGLLKKSNDI